MNIQPSFAADIALLVQQLAAARQHNNELRNALQLFVRCTNSTNLDDLIPKDLEICNQQARAVLAKATL